MRRRNETHTGRPVHRHAHSPLSRPERRRLGLDEVHLAFDARYDFDWPGAPTLLVGKKLKIGNMSVTPVLGYIGGDYAGPTAQVTTWWEGGKNSLFTLNQVAKGGNENPDFALQVSQFRHSLSKNFSVGLDGEIYAEKGAKLDVQTGPAINVAWGDTGFYTTVWYAMDTGTWENTKTFVGIGRSY
jgi:hypothetical protein